MQRHAFDANKFTAILHLRKNVCEVPQWPHARPHFCRLDWIIINGNILLYAIKIHFIAVDFNRTHPMSTPSNLDKAAPHAFTYTSTTKIQFTAKTIPCVIQNSLKRFFSALHPSICVYVSLLFRHSRDYEWMGERQREIFQWLHLKLIRLTFNSIWFSRCTAHTQMRAQNRMTFYMNYSWLAKCGIISYAKVQNK